MDVIFMRCGRRAVVVVFGGVLLLCAPTVGWAQVEGPHGVFRPAVRGQFVELVNPQYVAADKAGLADTEPVCGLATSQTVRCFPLKQLWYHHVVNDTWDGERLALTYCVMAHTATTVRLAPDAAGIKVGGIEAGTLVLGDRGTTGVLWPQIRTTVAAAGQTTAPQVSAGPPPVLTTWGLWRKAHPNTQVLAPIADFEFQYEVYTKRPQGVRAPIVESTVRELDPRLPPDTEVFGVHDGQGRAVAWPLSELEKLGEVTRNLGAQEVRVRWDKALRNPVLVTNAPGVEGVRARWFSWSSYYRGTELP